MDLRLAAARLGINIEYLSLILVSLPRDQAGRYEGLLVLDQQRELLRSMFPDAISPDTTAILDRSNTPVDKIH